MTWQRLTDWYLRERGSGARVAGLYHRALSLCVAIAFVSLAVQLDVLYSDAGLLPIAPFVAQLRAGGVRFFEVPSLWLWVTPTLPAMRFVLWLGVVLALTGVVTGRGRVVYAYALPVYLSFVTVGRTFFSFQWDSLLLESMVLGMWLPRRRSPVVHCLFRVLLFKLYWESGIAKWQSHLHDWHDGSAMTFYYETAPIPAPLAYWLHALPAWWHRFESWSVLVLELLVPCFVFGPRRARRFALLALTAFQIVNFSSGNYGFFVPLALALHLFLLDETDLARWPWLARETRPARLLRVEMIAAFVCAALYLVVSIQDARVHFAGRTPTPLEQRLGRFRAINTYHLFGHITRERIEPQVEVLVDDVWQPLDLHRKPGALDRTLPFSAPHQPRVDFQLWFFGLAYESGTPTWAATLLERVCTQPATMRALFATPIPAQVAATRYTFWQYRFTPPLVRATTGALWQRELRGTSRVRRCSPQ